MSDCPTYSYDEAYNASLKYFNNNELSASVFVDKYALRNDKNELVEKTPDDMHRRLAKEFARIEKKKFKTPYTEEELYSFFKNFEKVIAQGSPSYGIGNNYQYVSVSNCFVINPPVDSYGGILKSDQELVQISKRRGGVGTDISHLRPEKARTRNSSRTSTGPITFAKRFSNSIREVGQDGRRGALMLTMNVHHPDSVHLWDENIDGVPYDVLINDKDLGQFKISSEYYNPNNVDFATCKYDKKNVTGANISLMLTDEFLSSVKDNTDYEQRWPVDSKNPIVSKKVNARKVWNKIIHSAWQTAEPGILFIDTIRKESPADCYSKFGFATVSTNPCQPGWSTVLTPNGIKTILEIKTGDTIWSKSGWSKITNKISNGIKKVFKYQTTAGSISCTENHNIISHGEKIPAAYAESIDILSGPYNTEVIIDPEIVMDGLILGDGTYHKASNTKLLLVGKDDKDYFDSEIKDLLIEEAFTIQDYGYKIKTSISSDELAHTYNRSVPSRFKFGNKNTICSFLRGLYTANGSICGGRITLKSSSFDIIEDVQKMLSSIGISSYYTTNKPSLVKFKNGEYLCKQSYDLNITSDREKFYNLIGFIQKYKTKKLEEVIQNTEKTNYKKSSFKINSTEFVGEEEVFEITVDNSDHTYWSDGFNISNCGEIPLSPYDSCRLMILNLMGFVKNPFTKDAYFDWVEFYKYAQILQRLMDDLVDLEEECILKIISKIKDDPENEDIKNTELQLWNKVLVACKNGRRTGSGLTAVGDSVAAIGLGYSSEEGIKFIEKVYQVLKFGCYKSSIDMAKEIGPFPIWNHDLEKDNPFLNRFKNEAVSLNGHIISGHDLWSEMKKYGRRNMALLTTAPTGTVSILAKIINKFNTSSGIEPEYSDEGYIRKRKIAASDENARVDFVDQNGDKWQSYKVYPPAIQEYIDISGDTELKNSPFNNQTAEKIDWKLRVKLQAAAQKHIDHSISSTVNLPKDVTVDKVREIYETAWEAGCKGITVYRDGCRTGVLSKEEIKKEITNERPKEINCDVHHIKVRHKEGDKFVSDEYFVLVGLIDDQPYEVFAGRNGHIDKETKSGKITRIKNHYKISFDNDTEIDDINNFVTDDEEALTRMISLSLRSNVDIHNIVKQLEKTSAGDMQIFCKSISRALKKYIPDGTEEGEKCPECDGVLIRQDGCVSCRECAWTKCS